MSRRDDMEGFTLIELMITIALLAILAAVAFPSFGQFIRNSQLQAQAEELKTFVQLARSEAVIGRTSAELTIVSDGPWEIIRGGSVLRQLEHDPARATLTATDSNGTALGSLTYFASGVASSGARFTVCRDQDPANGYLVTVEPSGSIQLHARGKDGNSPLDACE